jgi:hypothetical protein
VSHSGLAMIVIALRLIEIAEDPSDPKTPEQREPRPDDTLPGRGHGD